VALASTWLVPRLPSLQQRQPQIDGRVPASTDSVDLRRGHVDIAVRVARLGASLPCGETVVDGRAGSTWGAGSRRARCATCAAPAGCTCRR